MKSLSITLLFGVFLLAAHGEPERERKVIDGVSYHLMRASAESVRVVWKDDAGAQLRLFPEVARYLEANGETPHTLMNGGIFEPGGIPSGLLVQNGKELRPVNRADGNGNFFLKPNGIFLVGPAGAAVIRTDEYPLEGVRVEHAVQSGPLLLRNGKIHPRLNADGPSRLHRNGVGVTRDGAVIFAMSDFRSPKYPNLHEFARLFSSLGCDDALFLDGSISQMRSGKGMFKESGNFGSFIAVVVPKSSADGRR